MSWYRNSQGCLKGLRSSCSSGSHLSWLLTGSTEGGEHTAFVVQETNMFANYLLLATRLRLGREVKKVWMIELTSLTSAIPE